MEGILPNVISDFEQHINNPPDGDRNKVLNYLKEKHKIQDTKDFFVKLFGLEKGLLFFLLIHIQN